LHTFGIGSAAKIIGFKVDQSFGEAPGVGE